MGMSIENTTVEVKRENWKKFASLIENQFNHGGEKYALGKDKEATDWVCEGFPGTTGIDWILGTQAKYLQRFKNFQRERDLLKIATYCYIAWLKMGFHKNESHDEDVKKEKSDV